MKKFLIIIGIMVVIAGLGILWIITSPKPSQQINPPGSSLPVASSTISTQTQTTSVGTQPDVAQAFRAQIQNANLITLTGTTVVSNYALQTWGDENKGGQALLQYDPTKGWVLVSMGGGAWDVPSLVVVGVPQSIAEQLIAGAH